MKRPHYRHKGYSLVKPVQVTRYLSATRRALVKDIGGTEVNLSAQQVILIDGCINILGIIRSMELYIAKSSVMEGKELAPCLKNTYLQYRNSLHKTLAMLGLNKRQTDEVLDVQAVIRKFDREKEEKAAIEEVEAKDKDKKES